MAKPQDSSHLVLVVNNPAPAQKGKKVVYPKFKIKTSDQITTQKNQVPAGYIFILQQPSLLEKKLQLEKSLLVKNGLTVNSLAMKKITEQIQSELRLYKEEMERQQTIIINRASSLVKGKAVRTRFTKALNGFVMDVSKVEAQQIKRGIADIKEIWPNRRVETVLDKSVPYIKADQVWKKDADGGDCQVTSKPCLTGQGVRIGIIDTGVDYEHLDLGGSGAQGCFGPGCKVVGGYDFVKGDPYPEDENGHGTHVAAIAAGKGPPSGVAPEAVIYAYKVLDQNGIGTEENVIKAIDTAVDLNPDDDVFPDPVEVINLSLGAPDGHPDDPLSRAVDNAVNNGVIVVVAAGNAGPKGGTITSPGVSRKAITVGATYENSTAIASFSSRGPTPLNTVKPDVTAPGYMTCAAQWSGHSGQTCIDDKHMRLSGTSMATSHIAGTVALMKQKLKNKGAVWTTDQIKYALRNSASLAVAIPFSLTNPNQQGHGRVNALSMVMKNVPPPTPVLFDHVNSFGIFDIKGQLSPQDSGSYELAILRDTEWQYGGGKILSQGNSIPTSDVLVSGFVSYPYEGKNFLRLRQTNSNGTSIDFVFLSINNFALSVPLFINKDVSIQGFINIPDHDGYRLEYADGASWTTIVESNSPYEGGPFGVFPASQIANGLYQLRLSVRWNGQWIVDESVKTQVIHELRDGWPQTTLYDAAQTRVYDSDQDGRNEIVVVEVPILNDITYPDRSRIYFWEIDGSLNYVNNLITPSYNDNPSLFKLSVYSDRDTLKKYITYGDEHTGLIDYTSGDHTAWFINQWPRAFRLNNGDDLYKSYQDPFRIIDIDGDGQDEIVGLYAEYQQIRDYLYIMDKTGNVKNGFPLLIDDSLFSNTNPNIQFAVADFDNDQNKEIAVVYTGLTNSKSETILKIFELDGQLRLEKKLLSVVLTGSAFQRQFVRNLTIADIDTDGVVELIVLVNDFDLSTQTSYVYVLDGNGKVISNVWPKSYNGIYESVIPANLDGGTDVELVLNAGQSTIIILKADGSDRVWSGLGNNVIGCGSVVGDIDADGAQEVVSWSRDIWATENVLSIFSSVGVVKKQIRVKFNSASQLAFCEGRLPIITDLDQDGKTDVVASSWVLQDGRDWQGIIFPLDLRTPYKSEVMEWPQQDYDIKASGMYPLKVSRPVQCSDKIDNDWDGLIDYPSDTGCLTSDSDNEASSLCGNGICEMAESCPYDCRPVFQTTNGQDISVKIEAEDFHANLPGQGGHTWDKKNDAQGYFGTGFMQALPDVIPPQSAEKDDPKLTYRVNFTNRGSVQYYVWVHGNGDAYGDSVHVTLDSELPGTPPAMADNMADTIWRNGFQWSKKTKEITNPVAFVQVDTPGEHKLHVWMREDGFRFDQLILTTNAQFVPSNTGSTGSGNSGGNSRPPISKKPQCSDGIDNDGDGKIDFPADPNCGTKGDNTEAPLKKSSL